jgi:hypothetical protein
MRASSLQAGVSSGCAATLPRRLPGGKTKSNRPIVGRGYLPTALKVEQIRLFSKVPSLANVGTTQLTWTRVMLEVTGFAIT